MQNNCAMETSKSIESLIVGIDDYRKLESRLGVFLTASPAFVCLRMTFVGPS
jgi:hypothetical protein